VLWPDSLATEGGTGRELKKIDLLAHPEHAGLYYPCANTATGSAFMLANPADAALGSGGPERALGPGEESLSIYGELCDRSEMALALAVSMPDSSARHYMPLLCDKSSIRPLLHTALPAT
jgi:hypothetical protein